MTVSVVATVVNSHTGIQNAITDSSWHFSICMVDSLEGPDMNVVEVGSVLGHSGLFPSALSHSVVAMGQRTHSQVRAIRDFFLFCGIIFLFKIDELWLLIFDSHSSVIFDMI